MVLSGFRLGLGLIAAWVIMAAPGLQSSALAAEVVLTMSDPFVITCVNPATPSLGEGAPGGLDAGLIGDADRLLLGDHEVGKRHYGTNDSVTVYFSATGKVTVRLGLWLSQWGSRAGEVLLDDAVITEFMAQAKPERPDVLVFELAGTGRLQSLTIRPLAGAGGYVHVDAIALSAEGPLEILNASGGPVLIPSAALPPTEAQAAEAAMTPAANVAIAGDRMSWEVTEEFPTAMDGAATYSGAAALDGQPARDYWAGLSPPPHALVLTWTEPVTINCNRILWLGANRGLWYGLEGWDGTRWRLLYEERRNVQPAPVYSFPPITTTRVRFTAYSVLGSQRMLMSAFELYNLPAGGQAQ